MDPGIVTGGMLVMVKTHDMVWDTQPAEPSEEYIIIHWLTQIQNFTFIIFIALIVHMHA